MLIQTLTVVTLPDGTSWLQCGDRMVRWHTAAEFLTQLGLDGSSAPTTFSGQPASQPASRKPKEPSSERRPRSASDPAAVARARERFESSNDKLTAIAEEVGMKLPTLFGIAKREGWTRKALVRRGGA